MYSEDRVLIAYMPQPRDFTLLQQKGWYRIPQRHAPKAFRADYIDFYFGRSFGEQKWAIHYVAPYMGHELVTRYTLLPHEAKHPRAKSWYYKMQLGALQQLPHPIISLHWRRLTFAHTTWGRLQQAREIRDLFINESGGMIAQH